MGLMELKRVGKKLKTHAIKLLELVDYQEGAVVVER